MDKLDENTKLMAYIPIDASDVNEFQQVLIGAGYDIELLTTEDFYKQVKFKQMSPRA